MSRNLRPKFYEFFAGGGMARLGLGEAWDCAFANDFDPVKARAYRANFPDAAAHFREGDVWALETSDLPGQADLAWASSPCQDFSLAGARAGLAGGRSSAFFGFWKLVQGLNAEGRAPKTIVIENVVGLLTSHGGADFQALCQALADEGYHFGALEIDANRFVPQSRPRVFVVATKENLPPQLVHVEPRLPFHSQRVVAAANALPPETRERWVWWGLPFPPASNRTLESVCMADDQVEWFDEKRQDALLALLGKRHQELLARAKGRGIRTIATAFRRMRVENGKKIQRTELRFDGFAGCLRTPSGGSSKQFIVVIEGDDVRVRSLHPNEAGALMGLTEGYSLPPSANAALKICGDGVVVDVVKWLSEVLLSPLATHEVRDLNEPERTRSRAN
ncbi:DNA cytosine methyltransferase [Phenylobacterium sp.]|uniref:DNA cytosine methyltransferase n=1 Tax=Phenylobacterium sp. TaxID=1871053 RepID=UPI002730D174|nr:DNA (cytosine-5-)-methyltransferase [Phenylobacterium sp.]MDP2214034.1 DNA (cytosine-5-)-methyltransferase [Phenylobacterium sp.]